MLHNTDLHEATLNNSSLFSKCGLKTGRSRLSQVKAPTVRAEGDTFTNLDEEAALVNVLFDSLLRNINFINVAAHSEHNVSTFLPSSKINAMLSVPRTKQQDSVVMLQIDQCKVSVYKTASGYVFKIKYHYRFARRVVRSYGVIYRMRLPKKSYEL